MSDHSDDHFRALHACADECDTSRGSASRREALKTMGLMSAFGAPILSTLAAGAAEAQTANDYRALVFVFFFGGNDQSNTVIPRSGAEYDAYASARPSLAIARDQILPITPQGFAGPELGLSPWLPGIRSLFEQGRAAVVANVGTLVQPVTRAQFSTRSPLLPLNLFSHSDQQTAWETGIPEGRAQTGWLGRFGDRLSSVFNPNSRVSINMSLANQNMVQIGQSVQQYRLASSGPVRISSLSGLFGNVAGGAAMRQLLTQPRANLLENTLTQINNLSIDNETIIGSSLAAAPPLATVFPSTNLGNQARLAARMMGLRNTLNQRRQIFFLSSGGWDFHENLLVDQQARLTEVDGALTALYQAIVEQGLASNVTICTGSDFGRALQFNGRGSDHGWGAHHFVIGGAVRGQRLYGTWPNVALGSPDDVGQGRLLPTTSVDQYAATLVRWLGATQTTLPEIIPNIGRFATSDLGFLG